MVPKAIWGNIMVERQVVQNILAWQACTACLVKSYVEPNWFQLLQQIFYPASLHKLVQACTSLPGHRLFENDMNQVGSTNF